MNTYSKETIHLSLSAQVAVVTFFMKSPVVQIERYKYRTIHTITRIWKGAGKYIFISQLFFRLPNIFTFTNLIPSQYLCRTLSLRKSNADIFGDKN